MSTNFSTNQFEGSFLPHKLQNYEVPQKYKQHPSSRQGHTQIITNDRGHIILPNRRSSARPWGHFVGTWQAPHKPVQLKVKTKFMSSSLQPMASSRPATAPASVTVSQKDGAAGSKLSPETAQTPVAHDGLQTIEETEQTNDEEMLNKSRSASASSNRFGTGSRPASTYSKKSSLKSTSRHSDRQSSLPHTPISAGGTPATDTRPIAPTPSDQQQQQLSSVTPSAGHKSASSNHGGGSFSRASSAPPSRLSCQTGTQDNQSRLSSHHDSGGTVRSGSSYRPHSRQGSYEGSGIGTSQGFRVYTPLSTALDGTTHTHTGVSNTPASNDRDKGIQCPSV